MPCALLPRRWQNARPNAVYNMYPANEAVREVCMKVRSMPEYKDRIKFSDIDRDIAEVKYLPDANSPAVEAVPTKVPLDGMVMEPDNVHLTTLGYQVMVGNVLNSLDLIENTAFGFKPVKQKPRKFRKVKSYM